MNTQTILRAVPVIAVLLAGSCAAPDDKPALTQDPAVNHPIAVEPSYQTLKVANSEPLSREDSEKLSAFAADFMDRGDGSMTIAAPAGRDAPNIIAAIGDQLVALGVPRSRILVGQQDQAGTGDKVEIGFITYIAHTQPCGDWSVDAAHNADNLPMPNYGCSVQQNIAAQVADPRDLVQPRPMGPSDTERRMQVYSKYQQGQITSSKKTPAQSAAVSDVASGSSGPSQ